MRARIPVLVAEHESANKPTGVVPKRAAASVSREQHMLRHCLRKEKLIFILLFQVIIELLTSMLVHQGALDVDMIDYFAFPYFESLMCCCL